jgi:hypothetical protein
MKYEIATDSFPGVSLSSLLRPGDEAGLATSGPLRASGASGGDVSNAFEIENKKRKRTKKNLFSKLVKSIKSENNLVDAAFLIF